MYRLEQRIEAKFTEKLERMDSRLSNQDATIEKLVKVVDSLKGRDQMISLSKK